MALQIRLGRQALRRAGGGNAGPYRGAKASLFEGGLRIPAVASWPGRVPQGEVRDQFCTGCDWFPTIAHLCEADLPERTIDGSSLVEVLASSGGPSPHEVWHWQLKNQWAVRALSTPECACRGKENEDVFLGDGGWKLICNAKDTTDGRDIQMLKGPFLVDLAEDPGEQHNVADHHPDVVKRLTKLHDKWVAEVDSG